MAPGAGLLADKPVFHGDFKSSVAAFVEQQQHVYLPLLDINAWLVKLSDGSLLHVYEEKVTPEMFACDCCRIVGWQTHPVSVKNWHFIVPAEVGPYSLADPTTLCAITEARGRGEHGSSRIALPAPDPDAPHQHQASLVFESKLHRLHGTVHSNGFGHLMRLNGREGGSRGATGRQLMQLWDDLCEALHVREVSTEDVSNKAGMELRVLHSAARQRTWYGQWRYGFGRGGFNMTPAQWHAAIKTVHSAPLAALWADFDGIDATVLDILQRYRDPAAAAAPDGGGETLGSLLHRMLCLLSDPAPILPAFEAAAAAEQQRQRLLAEQKFLMQAYLEQQRALAAQHAHQPVALDRGPEAAYFDASAAQAELARQQRELFALASQPSVAAPATAAEAHATDGGDVQGQPGEPGEAAATAAAAAAALALPAAAPAAALELGAEATGADPEGAAAAPSGEPEHAAAEHAAAAAAAAADDAAAAAHATAQAAVAAAVMAVDGTARDAVAAATATEHAPLPASRCAGAQAPVAAAPAAAGEEAAAAAAGWLADYASSGSEQQGGSEGGRAVFAQGTLSCRAAAASQPPLADAELPPEQQQWLQQQQDQEQQQQQGPDDVLRLRGGGRKRAADASPAAAAAAAKKPRGEEHADAAGDPEPPFGAEVVGRSVAVYWKDDRSYYTATVARYDARSGKHKLAYRDGDEELVVLHEEKLKWLNGVKPRPHKQEQAELEPAEEAAPPPKRGKAAAAAAAAAGSAGNSAAAAQAPVPKREGKAAKAGGDGEGNAGEEEGAEDGARGGGKALDPARRGLGPALVGVSLKIFWPAEKKWKTGRSTSYARRCHSFLFDDGSRAPIDLLQHRFEVLDKEAAQKLAALRAGAGQAQAARQRSQEAEEGAAAASKAEAQGGGGGGKVKKQRSRRPTEPSAEPEGTLSQQVKTEEEQQQQEEQQQPPGKKRRQPKQQAARRGKAAGGAPPEEQQEQQQQEEDQEAQQQQQQQQGDLQDDSAAVASALAAAAVANAVAANTPDAAAGPAQAKAEAAAAPHEAHGRGRQRKQPAATPAEATTAAAAGAAEAAASQPAALPPRLPPGASHTAEQLLAAALRMPTTRDRAAVDAAAAAGGVALGCGGCRFSTGGCRRCRPRLVKRLEEEGLSTARLQLLGGCQACREFQHGCPVCWRMIWLAGQPAEVERLLAAATAAGSQAVGANQAAAAEATAAEGGAAEEGGAAASAAEPEAAQRKGGAARGKRKQLEAAAAAAAAAPALKEEGGEAAAAAPAADAKTAAEPGKPAAAKKRARKGARAEAAAAAAAAAPAAATPAATPADTPAQTPAAEAATPASEEGGAALKAERVAVDEAQKAAILQQRSGGAVVLGCGRCRYRGGAGCVDCRLRALQQMKQEGLEEALAAIGCAACRQSDKGCRKCWPVAVAAAQAAQAARPQPPRPPSQQQQQQDGEQPTAQQQLEAQQPASQQQQQQGQQGQARDGTPAASAAPPPSPAAGGLGSASARRNKAVLAVNRETVSAAHAAGKFALGCGRCRWSLTGGCHNCRARSAEELRKREPSFAARLGCEHCEGAEDGCPHCWKQILGQLGQKAVLAAPEEQLAAAVGAPPGEDEDGAGAGAHGSPAAMQQQQKGGKAGKQRQAAAAAAAAAPGMPIRFGSRITNMCIRVWWSGDSTFYKGRVTSYKQGLHRVLYDEDGAAEKLDLLQQRFQLRLHERGEWLEFDKGVPVGEAAQAAVHALASPGGAASLPAAQQQQPLQDRPLGVAVRDLLQKRVRVLRADGDGQWAEGVVSGYSEGKFAVSFDDGGAGRYRLQQEQWEPLDPALMAQRQEALRAAAAEAAAAAAAAAAADGGARQPASPRIRAKRAAAAAALGGYAALLAGEGDSEDEEMEEEEEQQEEEEEGDGGQEDGGASAEPATGSEEWPAQAAEAPPPVPGAAEGPLPPPAATPRAPDQLPEPLALSPEVERARKAQYKFGLHKYVGQRVRLWLPAAGSWAEGEITSYGQGRHKVQFYDGSRASFNMLRDAFQLLPHPGSLSQPSPLLPPVAAASGGDGAAAPQRWQGMPPPPPRAPSGPPILDGDLLPVPRDQLKHSFELPPCTQPFQLDRICRVLRLILEALKAHAGQWVPKAILRQHLQAAGVRDNSLMDYCGRSLELQVLDGWAVYRCKSSKHNCIFYLAERVGPEEPPTEVAEPPRAEPQKRGPRRPDSQAWGAAAAASDRDDAPAAAPLPTATRQQRRLAYGNVRRGGGALSPRAFGASAAAAAGNGGRRQQPWQMFLPAGLPQGALTPEACRNQVMADLVYFFNRVLRSYRPAEFVAGQRAARAAQLAAAGDPEALPPLRQLRLEGLAGALQTMRDCKHFVKIGSGERLGEEAPPPGMMRVLCHLAVPQAPPHDAGGASEPSWAAPVRPPPELLLLPADATVGQLLAAATAAYRGSYRMCAGWDAEQVVAGLKVAVPPPLALPSLAHAAAGSGGDAAEAAAAAGAAAMELDGGCVLPEAERVAAGAAAAALAAAVAGVEAMEVEEAAAAAAPTSAAAAGEEDREAALAARVAAAAAAAVVTAFDGPAAAAAFSVADQLAACQLDPLVPAPAAALQQPVPSATFPQQQQQQQVVEPSPEQAAAAAAAARRDAERAPLLAARLAELLLPPGEQDGATSAAAAAGTPALGATLPAVTVAGRGLDWSVCWRHAGGLEDWAVHCRCGVHDDDGERMLQCDCCEIWMHTRCHGIDDDDPVPDAPFLCDTCKGQGGGPEAAAAARAALHAAVRGGAPPPPLGQPAAEQEQQARQQHDA